MTLSPATRHLGVAPSNIRATAWRMCFTWCFHSCWNKIRTNDAATWRLHHYPPSVKLNGTLMAMLSIAVLCPLDARICWSFVRIRDIHMLWSFVFSQVCGHDQDDALSSSIELTHSNLNGYQPKFLQQQQWVISMLFSILPDTIWENKFWLLDYDQVEDTQIIYYTTDNLQNQTLSMHSCEI